MAYWKFSYFLLLWKQELGGFVEYSCSENLKKQQQIAVIFKKTIFNCYLLNALLIIRIQKRQNKNAFDVSEYALCQLESILQRIIVNGGVFRTQSKI